MGGGAAETGTCSDNEDCGAASTCINVNNRDMCLCPGGIKWGTGACRGTYQHTLASNSAFKVEVPRAPAKMTIDVGKCITLSIDTQTNYFQSRFVDNSTSTDLRGDFTGDITFLVHHDEHVVSSSAF